MRNNFWDVYDSYGGSFANTDYILAEIEVETRANALRQITSYFVNDVDIAIALAKNIHTPKSSLQRIYKMHYDNPTIGIAIAKHPKASEELLLRINPPNSYINGGWAYRADFYSNLTLREDLTNKLLDKIIANTAGTVLPVYFWKNKFLSIQQVNYIWKRKDSKNENSHVLYRLLEWEEKQKENFNPFYSIKWMLAEDENKISTWCRQLFGNQAQKVLISYLQGYDYDAEQLENLPLEWLSEFVVATNDVTPVMT